MTKRYSWVLPLLIGCFGCLLTIFTTLLYRKTPRFIEKKAPLSSQQDAQTFRIAIVMSSLIPVTQKVMDCYTETLSKIAPHATWKITPFIANGNPQLLHSMAEECFTQRYDLIVTIGLTAMQSIYATKIKRDHYKTPIISSNTCGFAWKELSENDPLFRDYFTGNFSTFSWDTDLSTFHTILPHCKKILIPLPKETPQRNVEHIKQLKNEFATRYGIECIIAFFDNNKIDVMPFLRTYLESEAINAIWYSRDAIATCPISSVVLLSERYHVPVYALDKNSIESGASYGISFDEKIPGEISARQTKALLIDKQTIAETPPIDLTNGHGSKFLINTTALQKQGITLDPRIIFLAQHGEVIDSLKKG